MKYNIFNNQLNNHVFILPEAVSFNQTTASSNNGDLVQLFL